MDKEILLSNPKGFCTEKYIRKHFPEEYIIIQQCEGRTFSERLYNYWYNEGKAEYCPVCKVNYANFRGILHGYVGCCSQRCAYSSKERSLKTKQTNLERYGVENVSQAQSIKDKKKVTIENNYGGFGWSSKEIRKRSQETILKKYGVSNPSQAQVIKDKKKQTLKENFGEDAYKIISQKAKYTNIERYGVENIFMLDSVKAKAREKYYEKCFKNREDEIVDIESNDHIYYTCRCPHNDCQLCKEKLFNIRSTIYRDRKRLGIELCTKLLPEQSMYSTFELFIRSILDKYNIEYRTNVRDVISPKELDIYIPSHNIAIECNGVYWHSSNRKEANYHYEKFKACKDKGIQLLTFWEDQYHNKLQIIESIIRSKLKLYDYLIGARECRIQEISQQESSSFINTYHIQGSTNSKIRIGLYYRDELVSVMTFSHRKGGQGRGEITWILDRYCVKSGYKISGGASRLMRYFISNYKPNTITSFASNDISDGELYKQLGFKETTISNAYWYIDLQFNRYHRSNFTKAAIVRRGWRNKIDKTWTEAEVMKEHNFYKIYDSGITKYVLQCEEMKK